MIKGFPIDGEVIHENFQDFLDHIEENRHHAPLKRCRSVAKPKRHSTISIGSIRAHQCGLSLIIGVDGNLMITLIPIKETKQRVLHQPL
jgi:hypothetical protein